MRQALSAPEAVEEASFDCLYRNHRGRLRSLIARRCGGGSEGEDVVQEAFARLLAAYGGKRLANPLGLLYRIAVNIVRDSARSDQFRRNQLDAYGEVPCCAAGHSDPEAALAARARLRRLHDAIGGMPPRCREVFVLHKLDGMSHSEVAAALGISRNMVEKHMIRAYEQLRNVDPEQDG